MIAQQVIYALKSRGATVELAGNNIRLRAHTETRDECRRIVLENREELIDYLRACLAPATSVSLPKPQSSPVIIDLETRSLCDLKKHGGRIYAAHHSTEVLSVAAVIDRAGVVWFPNLQTAPPSNKISISSPGIEVIHTFAGHELPKPLLDAITSSRPFCGHNVDDFDSLVWRAQGWPEPTHWIDTIHIARAACLPAGIDGLGQLLMGHGKDREGQAVLKALSKPDERGLFRPLNAKTAAQLGIYNLKDVLICQEVYERFRDCGEPDVIALSRTINERGMRFDVELARRLIRISDESKQRAVKDMERNTDGAIKGADLRRDKYLSKWLREHGLDLPNMQWKTIEQRLLGFEFEDDVRSVLNARLVISRNSTSKLEAGIIGAEGDGRLRDMFVYHGAHTGRWSGKGVQPQNLPRPSKSLKDVTKLIPAAIDFDTLRSSLPSDTPIGDAISALIRPCFTVAPGKTLIIADFAAVEARGVAWCASDARLLTQFAAGEDVYLQFASKLFGRTITKKDDRERNTGKAAILACGYGMGQAEFEARCLKDGVDLERVGLTAQHVIEGYRDAYPSIAGNKMRGQYGDFRSGGLWKDLEDAARRAIEKVEPRSAGKCNFEFVKGDLIITIPSGRKMYFRDARLELRANSKFGNSAWKSKKPDIMYRNHKQRGDETIYGGKLTENIVSGICRDLQVAAMRAMEASGLPIVLHVHDEIVVEVPIEGAESALERMLEIMSAPPSWAAGFPIQVEGFCTPRYVKSPPAGVTARKARNGQVLPAESTSG